MASEADILIKVSADTEGAQKGLKDAAGGAESFGSRFKSTFAGILGANVVQDVASKVVEFGKSSMEAYEGAEKSNMAFEQAMRQIPGASDETTKSLSDQAVALSKVTTYSDVSTKSAMANLAQFHLTGQQISQLIPLVQDYATRTGVSLPKAATQVGKALMGTSGPLKKWGIDLSGATSATKAVTSAQNDLTRTQKTLTSAQEHLQVVQGEINRGQLTGKSAATALASAQARVQEATLHVRDAHTALAQAQANAGKDTSTFQALVGQLTQHFGGLSKQMGETSGGQMKIMQNQIEATKIQFGQALAPAVETVTGLLLKLLPTITGLATTLVKNLAPIVQRVAGLLETVGGWVQQNTSWLKPLAEIILGAVAAYKAWTLATQVWSSITKIATAVQAAFNLVMDADPFMLVVVAIAALVAGIVYLATQTKFFQNLWKAVWSGIQAAFNAVKNALVAAFHAITSAAQTVWQWIKAYWPILAGILTGPFGLAIALIVKYWAQVRSGASAVVTAVRGFFSRVGSYISAPFVAGWQTVHGWILSAEAWVRAVPGAVAGAVAGLGAKLAAPFVAGWQTVHGWILSAEAWVRAVPGAVAGAVASVAGHISQPFISGWQTVHGWIDTAEAWVRAVPGAVAGALASVAGHITAPFVSGWNTVHGWIGSAEAWFRGIPGSIASALGGVFNAITGPFRSAWNWVNTNIVGPLNRAFGSITSGITGAKNSWNALARAWNSIHITLPKIKIPLGPTIGGGTIGLPHLPTLAAGGYIPRATLAVVGEAGGEYVLPEARLRQLVAQAANAPAAGKPVTVNVNVTVPPTANPAETGRAVAAALRSYFSAGGRLQVPGRAAG